MLLHMPRKLVSPVQKLTGRIMLKDQRWETVYGGAHAAAQLNEQPRHGHTYTRFSYSVTQLICML